MINHVGHEHQTGVGDGALRLVNHLKEDLVAVATGARYGEREESYRTSRMKLRAEAELYAQLPQFVRDCSDLQQFWYWIKSRHASYQERREFIWASFAPLTELLESQALQSRNAPVTGTLELMNAEGIRSTWEKALRRRFDDPDGAITAARALIETVCKHILDDAGIPYSTTDDLPKLWHMTAKMLKLAPSQHQDEMFRAILGNCQSIVDRLAAIRNSVGDAHGQGRSSIRPTPKHAELAVNLAGSMAAFLVAIWDDQNKELVLE